ncbi:hypothetical protein ON010_g5446 [Phytophthora cinnamomi]|nr:hypothetical protein ON010_g5446 [Phytophthora cinnamomi]
MQDTLDSFFLGLEVTALGIKRKSKKDKIIAVCEIVVGDSSCVVLAARDRYIAERIRPARPHEMSTRLPRRRRHSFINDASGVRTASGPGELIASLRIRRP